jgi:hypothetical protein
MDNPYQAPATSSGSNPKRPYARLDIAALIGAAMPIVDLVGMKICYFGIDQPLTGKMASIMLGLMLAVFILWVVSGIYNVIGSVRGRTLPLCGIGANVVSFVSWVVMLIYYW